MRPFPFLGVVLALGACGGHDGGHDAGTSYNCAAETRDDEFVLGLTKTGEAGRLEFKLLTADPAPPARGDNTWQLQLSTLAGPAPVSDASMSVRPFMPDHTHGSGKSVVVTPLTEPGQYELSPVNLWMPGLWEVTIQVSGASGDRVVFRFCLPS